MGPDRDGDVTRPTESSQSIYVAKPDGHGAVQLLASRVALSPVSIFG